MDSHDLRIQLTTIEKLAKEHRQASAAYCEALTTAGTSDADLEKEIEANADKEALYESYINTISRILRQQAVLTSYERIMTSLETWLANSAITTTDYLTEGRTISKELDQVVSQMRSIRKIPVFQSLLDKAVGGLEEVRTHLLKSPSPAVPRIEAAAVPVTTARSHATILQLKPPTFSGEIRDFHGFDQRFMDMINSRPDITSDADKVSLLREAMLDPALKAQVEQYGRGPDGFRAAREALRIRYGRASVVFPVYVKEMIQKETYSYNQESMLRILDRTKHLAAAMKDIKGDTLSQVMVQLAVFNFNDELSKEWTKYMASKEDIPDLDQLVKFVEPLSHTLPFQAPQSAGSKSSQVQKKESQKKTSNGDSRTSQRLTDCPLCKNTYHHLQRCSVFTGYSVGQRQSYINRTKGCSNCLHHSYVVGQCNSAHTCRQCKGRHHTLLHRDENTVAATSDLMTVPATMDNTTEPQTLSESAVKDLPLRRGFILTALLSLRHGDRRVVVRAGLDSCSGSSLVSERIASLLKVKRHSTHMSLSGVVSDTTIKQYCSIEISTILLSDLDLQLSMAISSRIPDSTPPVDVKAVRNNDIIKGEPLADGHLGGQLDVLISTCDMGLLLLPEPSGSALTLD